MPMHAGQARNKRSCFSPSFSLSKRLAGRPHGQKHSVEGEQEVKKRSLSLGCLCDGRPVGTTDVHDVMPEEGWRDAGRSERHEGGQRSSWHRAEEENGW